MIPKKRFNEVACGKVMIGYFVKCDFSMFNNCQNALTVCQGKRSYQYLKGKAQITAALGYYEGK